MSIKPGAYFLPDLLDDFRDPEKSHRECLAGLIEIWTQNEPVAQGILLQELLVSRGFFVFMAFVNKMSRVLFPESERAAREKFHEVFAMTETTGVTDFAARIPELYPDLSYCQSDMWYVLTAGYVEGLMPLAKPYLPDKVHRRLGEISRLRAGQSQWTEMPGI